MQIAANIRCKILFSMPENQGIRNYPGHWKIGVSGYPGCMETGARWSETSQTTRWSRSVRHVIAG